MNATAIKLIVTFWHDDCPEGPSDMDGWKVHSFSRRHHNYSDPYELGLDEDGDPDQPDLARKLKEGLAFRLSYFEHGNCIWSLRDELPPGANCRWDSVGMAGLLIWEQDESDLGPQTYEDRQADARRFMERYTYWCNGEVYGYTVKAFRVCPTCGQNEEVSDEEAGLDLPSCGGYYPDDIDGLVIDLKDHIGSDWKDYEVEFREQYSFGLAEECEKRWKGENA